MENNEKTIIKLKIALEHIFFPKSANTIKTSEFGIFSAFVLKVIDGEYDMTKIKLKGTCCNINYNQEYTVYCQLEESTTKTNYNDTYSIIFISQYADLSDKNKQKLFLQQIVSENIVNNIFDMYEENIMSILENKDINSLIQVKGIKHKTAQKLINKYEDVKDYSEAMIELIPLGLTKELIIRLVKYYKTPQILINIIKNDTYKLIETNEIGFKKVDKIALDISLNAYDSKRITAFIKYYLKIEGESGNSYIKYNILLYQINQTLGNIPYNIIYNVITEMIRNHEVITFGYNIALMKYYKLELDILKEIKRINICDMSVYEDDNKEKENEYDDEYVEYIPKRNLRNNINERIKEIEDEQGFPFVTEQLEAIKTGQQNNVIIITGGGGVGKTTTVRGIIKTFPDEYKFICMALSGRASLRITEATGLPAGTIHRMMGWDKGEFFFNEKNPLKADGILVDEATMINGTLFLSILKAIPTGARLILVGDVQQLLPIGNCQVFYDLLYSDAIAKVKLIEVHRQALKSGIITTSMKVSNQEEIYDYNFIGKKIIGELLDMELQITNNNEIIQNLVITKFEEEYKKCNEIMEIQICSSTKLKGILSCYELNILIQNIVNPVITDKDTIKITISKNEDKYYQLHKGDKVINTKNNYKSVTKDNKEIAIFNGNFGIIKEISTEEKYCIVDFAGIGEVVLTLENAKNLDLAYACTIHKLQGSSAKNVIVALNNSCSPMNTAELLYTAITRAEKYCTLIALNSAVQSCIRNRESRKKQTFLLLMLQNKIPCFYLE